MKQGWFYSLGLALSLAGAPSAGWAANCGDTTGAGGTRVACACGDTVTTNTKLKNTDPVVSTSLADTCSGDGLAIGVSKSPWTARSSPCAGITRAPATG